ncbi:MAG: riboflavin biosynthesis protein RibF [Candidatus Omnitrophota bacterium]
MNVLSDFSKIKKDYFGRNILILGIFDGVHLGHQYLIKKAVIRARRINAKSIIFTLWPHPKQADSIMPIFERIKFFINLGVDFCIVKKFTQKFACLSASDFFKLVVKKINPVEIFVGENFHFGKDREGDIDLLKNFCKNNAIKLEIVRIYRLHNQNISSSAIRNLINKGDLKKASLFLGRPVYIIGKVTEGKALGRKLGYPTANIIPFHEVLPPSGIYAVEVIFKKDKFFGMAYINRDSFPIIEAHIFNFKKNIYGSHIKLLFFEKIRPVKRFKDIAALKNQLKKDEIIVRNYFLAKDSH